MDVVHNPNALKGVNIKPLERVLDHNKRPATYIIFPEGDKPYNFTNESSFRENRNGFALTVHGTSPLSRLSYAAFSNIKKLLSFPFKQLSKLLKAPEKETKLEILSAQTIQRITAAAAPTL